MEAPERSDEDANHDDTQISVFLNKKHILFAIVMIRFQQKNLAFHRLVQQPELLLMPFYPMAYTDGLVTTIKYLEYCKTQGSRNCHLWAWSPSEGEDYILYCQPEIHKAPKYTNTRGEWYLSILCKPAEETINVGLTNAYDHFFLSISECKAMLTAVRLPYFNGAYWPGAAEHMIFPLQQEDESEHHKHEPDQENSNKEKTLQEDSLMVQLHTCTRCCILLVSGNRWACRECKSFELCDNCYDSDRKPDDNERQPKHQKDKHALYPVKVTKLPDNIKSNGRIEVVDSELLDSRHAFLSLRQGNLYQCDKIRRAKRFNFLAFTRRCNVCTCYLAGGKGWSCEICADYDVCYACYHKGGGIGHLHVLTNCTFNDSGAQNKPAWLLRITQEKKMRKLVVHACQCRISCCQYPYCLKVKRLLSHCMLCKVRASRGCFLCKKTWYLLQLHARECRESVCRVPRCRDLRDDMADTNRSAVEENMKQRAAAEAAARNS